MNAQAWVSYPSSRTTEAACVTTERKAKKIFCAEKMVTPSQIRGPKLGLIYFFKTNFIYINFCKPYFKFI